MSTINRVSVPVGGVAEIEPPIVDDNDLLRSGQHHLLNCVRALQLIEGDMTYSSAMAGDQTNRAREIAYEIEGVAHVRSATEELFSSYGRVLTWLSE